MKRCLCVLLVEDDPVLGPVMAEALRHLGHDLILAPTAEAAYQHLIVHRRIELILLDLQLCGERAEPMIERLRREKVDLPPIIILSAQPEAELRKAAIRVNATRILHKPASLEQLDAVISGVVA